MPNIEIELNPIDFVTIGTIGPKGQRVFYLQAGQSRRLVSLVVEKEQSWALSEAVQELLKDLDERLQTTTSVDMSSTDMDLREPIEPAFRVSRMGLGYDEDSDRVILIAQELVIGDDDDEDDDDDEIEDELDFDGTNEPADPNATRPSIVRLWCTREQILALSIQAADTVRSGRADPRLNGRLVYYWT